MINTQNACLLARNGYRCSVEIRPPFRGHSGLSPIISVERGGFKGFAKIEKDERIKHHQRIKQVQDQLLYAPKIVEIIDRVVIVEWVAGTLVWDMASRPDADQICGSLQCFADSLAKVELTHADIRPWNIILEETTGEIRVIDWGFSVFWNDTKHGQQHREDRGHRGRRIAEVDMEDVRRTIKVIRGELSPEEAWKHESSSWNWRPAWIRSQHGRA